MKRKKLAQRATSAALAACMMFTLSAPALAESTDALMQLSMNSRSSISVLDAANSGTITVNGNVVSPGSYSNILGGTANTLKLMYDEASHTIVSNGTITGDLNIDAGGNDVVLDTSASKKADSTYVLDGNLTITNAGNVTLSSKGNWVIATGNVNVECSGTFKIPSCKRVSKNGTLTVNAGAVEIEGNDNAAAVTGSIVSSGTVTISNSGGGPAIDTEKFTYNNGGDYVYYTAADGKPIDPRVTPIDGSSKYLRIAPETLVDITTTNAKLNVPDNKAYPGTEVTATVDAPADTRFDGWEVSDNVTGLDETAKKNTSITFTMPDTKVALNAKYAALYDFKVKNGTTTVPGSTSSINAKNQTTTTAKAAKDDVVEIEGINFDPDVKAFDYWKVETGDAEIASPYSEKTTVTIKGDSEVTVKAMYMTPRKVTVTDGNGTVTGKTQHGTNNIFAGDTVEVAAKELAGKQFEKWESDTELTDESGNVLTGDALKNSTITFKVPGSDVTLTAVYNDLYTVSVVDAEASVSTGIAGTGVTVTAKIPAGEKFTGWKLECDDPNFKPDLSSETVTFNMPNANVKLTAEHKTIHTFTVVGGTIDGKPEDVTTIDAIEGDKITVHPDLPENQEFLHWKGSGYPLDEAHEKDDPLVITMPNNDVTITAVPKQLYTVSVTYGTISVTNGTVSNGGKSATVNPGETVTLTAADRTNLDEVFVGWKVTSVDENGNPNVKLSNENPTSFIMIGANVTVEAKYKELHTVTVLYQIEDGDTTEATDKKQEAIVDKDITVTAADKTSEDLIFDHWEVKVGNNTVTDLLKDKTDSTANFKMQDANVTLTAVYKKLYTITITNNVNVNEVESVGKTKVGGTVHLEAKDISGWRFKGWTVIDGNATLEGSELTLNAGGDVLVRADYVKLYDLTVKYGTPVNNDVETPTSAGTEAGEIVLPTAEDDSVTVTADAAKPGQHFTGWTVEGLNDGETLLDADNKPVDLTKESITFKMPGGPVKLTANYSYVHDRTVTVKYDDDVNNPAPESEVYTPGTKAEINVDARNGDMVFDHWEVEQGSEELKAELNGKTVNPLTFTVPESENAEEIILVAHYKELHSIKMKADPENLLLGEASGDDLFKMVSGDTGAVEGKTVKITADMSNSEDWEFVGWEITDEDGTIDPVDKAEPETTFVMRNSAVTVTAKYQKLYTVTVHNEIDPADMKTEKHKAGDTVEIEADKFVGNKRFDHWKIGGTLTADDLKLEDVNGNSTSFTMIDGDVDLTAVYVDLNNVNVKYGTAVNEDEPETKTTTEDIDDDGVEWVVLPAADGDEITVTAADMYGEFEGWQLIKGTIYDEFDNELTTDEDGYILKDGERLTETSFTFKMGTEGVSLKAVRSIPAYPITDWSLIIRGGVAEGFGTITDGGTAYTGNGDDEEEIERNTITAGTPVTVRAATPDADTYPGMQFDYWEIYGNLELTEEELHSQEIKFNMPKGGLVLIPHWKLVITPADPLDPDFGVDYDEPTGGDGGAGAVIAGVAIGGAAIWGGYEITTRIILNDLLPAGAAIPGNRGELAMLIWTEKGKPEPAAQPAFADVSDAEMAKAAQWCVEQGLLDAQDGKFDPDGWMPKFKTIEIWKKAFPQQ